MLATSYTVARGLIVTPMLTDFEFWPAIAIARRDAELVVFADAAAMVPDRNLWRLSELIEVKGFRCM